MIRILSILSIAFAAALCGLAEGQPNVAVKPVLPKHDAPPLIHLVKGVVCSPYNKDHTKFPRGLKPSTKEQRASAVKFDGAAIKAPAQVLMVPTQLSMWGNSQYGDCVTASEVAGMAAYSVYCGLPETFVTEAVAIAWAQKGGYLNGANLTDVMTDRMTRGITANDGKTYVAGPYASVDFTSESTLQVALTVGPVNVGMDANALPSGAGNANAWYAFGGTPGSFSNEDHCCRLFGYGTAAACFQVLGAPVPANAPTGTCYLYFTWSTIGVVDYPWLMSTLGEAWVQNPTTVGQSPNPTPPVPPIPPIPTPPNGTPIIVTLNPDGTWSITGLPSGNVTLTQAQMDALKIIQTIPLAGSNKIESKSAVKSPPIMLPTDPPQPMPKQPNGSAKTESFEMTYEMTYELDGKTFLGWQKINASEWTKFSPTPFPNSPTYIAYKKREVSAPQRQTFPEARPIVAGSGGYATVGKVK